MGISQNGDLPLLSIHGFKPLDLDDLREQVHQTMDFIMDYYKKVESFPVLPSVQPGYLRHLLPATPPAEPTTFDAILCDLHRAILPGLTHWASPNFFAYFPATLSSAALAGDLLASAFNPVAFTWLSSPAATELESLVLDWLAHLLRLPSCFLSSSASAATRGGGVLHNTTSEAMLCTLVAARDAALRRSGGFAAAISRLVAYGSDQTHSTFFKACRIAGFDPANVRSVPTRSESDFSLEPARLRAAMAADAAAGLVPAYVCATVGTTSSTAVDPVGPISEVAAEFGAWVHVDAAYAGSACVCPEFRQYLDGVERANSVSFSPHKWLLTCLDCTCLWVRDTRLLTGPLGTDPEYLKNGPSESGSVVDLKDLQVGVGRRFRSLKLWMVIRTYGVANLQAHIRSDVEMARRFEGMVRSDRRFEVVVPRRFALVCFRLMPRGGMVEAQADKENRRLLEMINASGRAYITHTVVGRMYVLRFAVGSTLTEERHVASAWELIKKKADELLGVEVSPVPNI
ncbi:tryptophan decarboxylase 1-like [Phoenix dactylifera]|uniref:Tryptophan decarboxylase 1-like n=1 Tax=Phoenix dactylifera TaxID=42345 RepID=A0A8B7C853_PHODC|nr:tryptophan decarboxylase 1-like [Phoenix dactylifera]